MKQAGTITFLENWEFILKDCNGNIIEKQEVTNTITNTWKNIIRNWMYDESGSKPIALAIGTGTTSETASDTSLETEYTRASANVSKPADYQIKFTHDFTFGSGTSEDITEAGLFDSAVASGSNMIARTTFSATSITASTTLTVTATITIA